MKLALLVQLLVVAPLSGGEPWYRRCLVGIEVGPTGANPDPNYMSRMPPPAAIGRGSRLSREGDSLRLETGEIHEVVVIED